MYHGSDCLVFISLVLYDGTFNGYCVTVHAMKAYVALAVKLQSFLTSAPDRGEHSASRPGRLTTGKIAPFSRGLQD
jgi:hypothetical protein